MAHNASQHTVRKCRREVVSVGRHQKRCQIAGTGSAILSRVPSAKDSDSRWFFRVRRHSTHSAGRNDRLGTPSGDLRAPVVRRIRRVLRPAGESGRARAVPTRRATIDDLASGGGIIELPDVPGDDFEV